MTKIDWSYIHVELLDSLKNIGWNGNWKIIDDHIDIDSEIGITLEEYIRNKPLDYEDGIQLILCLSEQLITLSKYNQELGEKYGVLFFNLKDIIVLSKNVFLLTNLSKVLPMTDDNEIILEEPISFDGFLAPELKGVDSLPFAANPTCAYYSLALLCLKALGLEFEGGLERLKGTKLYFFLQRCLENDPKKRHIIYI